MLRHRTALLALALVACGRVDAPGARFERVLLLVTDATHEGQIDWEDPATTPTLGGLARDGVRFARAFSNTTWTLASTASLMTGRLQENHGAVTNEHALGEEAETLPELFQQNGYRTAAFVQMAYAAPDFGFGQGFDEFHYSGENRRAGNTIPKVLAWIEERRAERWFVYLHLRRPHSPYRPNPRVPYPDDCPLAGGERDEELEFADLLTEDESLTDVEREHLVHLYGANLATVDQLLHRVIPLAREAGALIVHTSDHGEALGQHGVYGHGKHLWAESVDIPLVFWWPGIAPRVDVAPASTVDVLPTLLELCDLPLPSVELDGHSLADRLEGGAPAERIVLVTGRYTGKGRPRVGVVDGDWKLVHDPGGADRLFHRLDDPRDERDRAAEEPELAARLAAIATAWSEEHADVAAKGTRRGELAPELLEDLRGLGYNE